MLFHDVRDPGAFGNDPNPVELSPAFLGRIVDQRDRAPPVRVVSKHVADEQLASLASAGDEFIEGRRTQRDASASKTKCESLRGSSVRRPCA